MTDIGAPRLPAPRAQVARELRAMIGRRAPLSDNPRYGQYWWWVLNRCVYPGVRVGALLDAIAGEGLSARAMRKLAHAHARKVAPRTHRAGDDVRHLLAILQALQRLSGSKG